jgi:hypothetical protein
MYRFLGARVALLPVDEQYEGLIVRPPVVSRRNYALGRVLGLGSTRDGFEVKAGDIVLLQVNDFMVDACAFKDKHSGKVCLSVPEGDILAKISSQVVKLETFRVVGNWALVREVKAESTSPIVIPETVKAPLEFSRFEVVQLGALCEVKLEPGREVVVDKRRLNPLELSGETYYYLNDASILGEVVRE